MTNDHRSAAEWRPPTDEEIRTRAYELYLERERYSGARYSGDALDDWLEAEAELWLKMRDAAEI